MSTIDTTTTADSPRTPTAGTNRAGFTTAIGLVIEREIMVRLKSKAFMVSTILSIILFGVLVGVSGALPSLFSSTDKVAVTSAGAKAIEGIEDIEAVAVDDIDEAKALITSEKVESAVVESQNSPTGVAVLSLRSAPESLIGALSLTPRSSSSIPTPLTQRSPTSSGSASVWCSSWPR
ncbi:ABC transporter permease family protein [Brevibacterium siliguriense]|uniref:hypothetical protein n=1 Tax=Brevibacterium siliguriense TaxID=1136497 RepID=UPI000AB60526|nr:hypothetical protein [Brevibacterium siliguriense]